jgi:hypothetical protein
MVTLNKLHKILVKKALYGNRKYISDELAESIARSITYSRTTNGVRESATLLQVVENKIIELQKKLETETV